MLFNYNTGNGNLRATCVKYYNTIHAADSPQCSRYTLVYVQNKIHIVVNKENYTYLLWFNSNHNDETENQILSTFKFTN